MTTKEKITKCATAIEELAEALAEHPKADDVITKATNLIIVAAREIQSLAEEG